MEWLVQFESQSKSGDIRTSLFALTMISKLLTYSYAYVCAFILYVNHGVIVKIDALFALRSYDETKIHKTLKPNSAVIDSDRSELRVRTNKQELDRGCEPPKKINWQSLSFGLSDNEQSRCKHYIICKTR